MITRALAIGAGFSLTLGFGLACLVVQGGLEAFLEIQWTFNRLVHGSNQYQYPLSAYIKVLHMVTQRCGLYLPLLAAVAATVLMWRRERSLIRPDTRRESLRVSRPHLPSR